MTIGAWGPLPVGPPGAPRSTRSRKFALWVLVSGMCIPDMPHFSGGSGVGPTTILKLVSRRLAAPLKHASRAPPVACGGS